MEFKPIFPRSELDPARNRSRPQGYPINFLNSLRLNLDLTTSLLIGATLQAILVFILPPRYALAPAILLLSIRFTNTLLITFGLKPNPYMQDVILKKSTAQPLDRTGNFVAPGQEKIAVLLLSAKCNHPLGIFAPNFKITGDLLERMTRELEGAESQESGFLGQSAFTRQDARGANENLFISYWRSLDDVHRYAHSPTHREAWRWWEKTLKENDHIGIMHEVFEAPKGCWEGVYVNFQPTMLGATTYLKREGKLEAGRVGDEWINPLMDANKGPFRSSLGRRGLENSARAKDMFVQDVYA